MLNLLVPLVMRLRGRFPRLYSMLVALGRRFLGTRLGVYPRVLGNEVAAVTSVLRSSQWNMTAGRGLTHEHLESEFASFVGCDQGVAVNTGGMALQVAMRALGVRPGDEVIHQVDTCSATALAVMAAGGVPIMADSSAPSMMLDAGDLAAQCGPRTRALIATHMWGNPEDMPALRALADAKRVPLIEDTCLSLGARAGGRMAGSWGDVAVFSFGCLKPIQGGEGGMILTNDRALAKEMRALRHWGDRTAEFGVRDTLIPSWNGRMSEVVAAVVREQLKGYPAHLAVLQRNVGQFARYLEQQPGLRLVLGHGASIVECAFTQIILELVPEALPVGKAQLLKRLYAAGVPVWHANFEPINTLTLFASSEWRNWMPYADLERVATNYARPYRGAGRIFEATGIGLGKSNFLSAGNLRHLIKALDAAIRE